MESRFLIKLGILAKTAIALLRRFMLLWLFSLISWSALDRSFWLMMDSEKSEALISALEFPLGVMQDALRFVRTCRAGSGLTGFDGRKEG